MNQKSLYITDFLQRRAQLTPERLAIRDTITGRDYTYAAWNAQANQTANYLRVLGVQAGDRVAVYATNSMAYLDIWMACGKIGAMLQNLNWRLTPAELEGLILDAAPVVLVYSDDFIEQVEQLAPAYSRRAAFRRPRSQQAQPGDHDFSERDTFPAGSPHRAPNCTGTRPG